MNSLSQRFTPNDHKQLNEILSDNTVPKFRPLEHNPCANVAVAKGWVCLKPGTLACSSCRLVSYCSKECQKAHWKMHRKDCNEYIRTEKWRPGWEQECRLPVFINNAPVNLQNRDVLSLGMMLWGNTPAIDLVNLKSNEDDIEKDFDLAFVASGDIRHVMKTINNLPDDFSGHLKILINDLNSFVASRNIVILIILSTITDEALAADVALHFWYSVFMPVEYSLKISAGIAKFFSSQTSPPSPNNKIPLMWPLGTNATMTGTLSSDSLDCLRYLTLAPGAGDVDSAQAEYDRVREAPYRADYRDRMYAGLRPSHRLAFREYRRYGLVLPFGAMNAHFNTPNRSLFAPDGSWLQTDYADPLEGWDINQIVEVGRARGAQAEDVYGCFYFYISAQLRKLWGRMRAFKLSIVMTDDDATSLARSITSGDLKNVGLSSSRGFDRIHVSNILDHNYVGLEGVLNSWAPLLSVNKRAAIVGYFMNWIECRKDARVRDLPQADAEPLMKQMVEEGKSKPIPKFSGSAKRRPSPDEMTRLMNDVKICLYTTIMNIDYIYDNSQSFKKYLHDRSVHALMRKNAVTLRQKHTIVPHRIGTDIDAPPDALPQFAQEDSWYYQSSLLSGTGWERFVEFSVI